MSRLCRVIAGAALAVTLGGCGESAPEGGTVEFKAGSSPAIEALRKQMSDNAKGGAVAKKPQTETKPAADVKSAPEKKPEDKKD